MSSLQQLAQKLENWDIHDLVHWEDICLYLGVSRYRMSQAIRFQRQNPALFDHVMAADENSGFYKRVARGKDLRRYIAYRDRVINTQNVTMNAIGLRDVNTSDLKTIDGQLALAIQNARLKSGELYKDALELPTILAKLPIKDQWILMRAINSK